LNACMCAYEYMRAFVRVHVEGACARVQVHEHKHEHEHEHDHDNVYVHSVHASTHRRIDAPRHRGTEASA
jgi:hypothetical protein